MPVSRFMKFCVVALSLVSLALQAGGVRAQQKGGMPDTDKIAPVNSGANPPDALTDPTDVVTAPENGDVYVAESHTDVSDPNLVARITVFIPPHALPNSPDGTMGEGIAVDDAGNVFTAEAQLRGITKYVKD